MAHIAELKDGSDNLWHRSNWGKKNRRECINYFPCELHTWYPVVLRQVAVKLDVEVVVVVVVVVDVPKYNKTRPFPEGALNPGWTTKGTNLAASFSSGVGAASD